MNQGTRKHIRMAVVTVLLSLSIAAGTTAQETCQQSCAKLEDKCREDAKGIYITCGQQGGGQEECERKRDAYLEKCGCKLCWKPTTVFGVPKVWYCVCGEPAGEGECGYSYDGTVNYCDASPIIIDLGGNGFSLTDVENGVDFDLRAVGIPIRTAWTRAESDDAWLALDRDGDGQITSGAELFGNFTAQPTAVYKNGFLALAEFDKAAAGGNGDGQIAPADAVYGGLRLWQDVNHNGISEASELHRLSSLGVAFIDLEYKEARRRDQYGNEFRYRAKVNGSRYAYDVFLRTQ